MRRKKALRRGRLFSILVAAGVGYLIGGWNAAAVRKVDLSAAQTVALRFPQNWEDVTSAVTSAVAHEIRNSGVMGDGQLALLSPQPMVAEPRVANTPVQMASADPMSLVPAAAVAAPRSALTAPRPIAEAKPLRVASAAVEPKAAVAAAASHRRAERPGFVLNDAQISSIKDRLHLTEDQQQMWPAVEAALRNIAYARAHQERRQGGTQVAAAAVDPNSVEVQGLKDAAVPLIMSFNSEQRDEVRNLAHVMGLDQLATQF
jgi:hypothetical protein